MIPDVFRDSDMFDKAFSVGFGNKKTMDGTFPLES